MVFRLYKIYAIKWAGETCTHSSSNTRTYVHGHVISNFLNYLIVWYIDINCFSWKYVFFVNWICNMAIFPEFCVCSMRVWVKICQVKFKVQDVALFKPKYQLLDAKNVIWFNKLVMKLNISSKRTNVFVLPHWF